MIETVPPGTILQGRYRIERVLGSGGFGHVYLAIDMVTSQQYAVKEYLVTGTTGQEQLQHEANVLSQLHHPNLPAFHDAFHERGRYYIVLNYIEGNDLTDLIRHARQRNDVVPVARIMGWTLAVCDAVLFLHNQHPPVIHRDIKPDNIRIMPDGTAILVDLGNAKAAADGARTLFFIRHQGTPGYAPQEQYPGGSGTDIRSDVYALGATLYFALTTQEPPSVSSRNQSIQQGQVDLPSLQEQLTKNPPEDSPEVNAARQFRLGVSKPGKPLPRHLRHVAQLGAMPPELLARLNLIIQRAMAMKQKDRYQSVAEFANDLKMVADAASMQAAPARKVDPHSTQPDLDMVFEAVQAQKAQQGQQGQVPQDNPYQTSPDIPGPVVSQPTSQGHITCPRCGASLMPKSAFCPHCGTSLVNSARASGTESPIRSSSAKMPSSSAMMSAQGMDQASGGVPGMPGVQPKPVTNLAASAFSGSQPSLAAPQIARAKGVGAQNSNVPHQVVPVAMQTRPAFSKAEQQSVGSGNIAPMVTRAKGNKHATKEFQVGPRMIFVVALVLIILLVLMIVLLVNQAHHAHAGIQITAQVMHRLSAHEIMRYA